MPSGLRCAASSTECHNFSFQDRSHTLWWPQKTAVLMLWVYPTVVSCSCWGMRDKHPWKQLVNIRKWIVLGSYLDTFHTHPDVSIRLGYELETWVSLSYTYVAVSWLNYNEVRRLVDEYRFVVNSWPSRAAVGISPIYRCRDPHRHSQLIGHPNLTIRSILPQDY